MFTFWLLMFKFWLLLDWPKSLYGFFLQDTRHIFHFANNVTDLNILTVDHFPLRYNIDCFQCFDLTTVSFNWSTRPWSIVPSKFSSMKVHKLLFTSSISHSTFPYTAQIFFCVSIVFLSFLKYKAWYAENVVYFLLSQY